MAGRFDVYEVHKRTLASLPGGQALIDAFGWDGTFHDGDVRDLVLSATGPSAVSVAYPGRSGFAGALGGKRIVVTFEMGEVADVELEDVSVKGILFSLFLRPRTDPNGHRPNYRKASADDLDLLLETSYGVSGRIVCRDVRVSWVLDDAVDW